jgi:5-methylcytosine-specific restriction endonuclease McrA
LVKRPRYQKKLSRSEVFSRDHYTCQYCGRQTKELTLDHVVPRRRGGTHAWDNVVSACIPCNRRKGGRTPEEARMKLLRQPRAPRNDGFYIPYHLLTNHSEWQKYLPSMN